MAGGEECQRSPMQLNDIIQVRQDAPLLEPALKAYGKVVDRRGSARIARWTERQ